MDIIRYGPNRIQIYLTMVKCRFCRQKTAIGASRIMSHQADFKIDSDVPCATAPVQDLQATGHSTIRCNQNGVILPSLNTNLTRTHPDPCLFQLTSGDSSLLSAIIQNVPTQSNMPFFLTRASREGGKVCKPLHTIVDRQNRQKPW
jgi:hypothetical protein